MDSNDSRGGSQGAVILAETGHPTMLLAGSSWEVLDYVHTVLGAGRQVEVICLEGHSSFPAPAPDVASVVVVAEEDGSLPEAARAWVAEAPPQWRERTVVCGLPGGGPVDAPEGVTVTELSPDPLELFDALAPHAAEGPIPGEDERMALLGFAESLAQSMVVGIEGLTGQELERQDLTVTGADHRHCVRLPMWCPTMGRKGMLAMSFSDSAAASVAEMMTGEDPSGMDQEEFDELVESAILEVANVAAGVVKARLHDLGVSSILRFPIADEVVSPEASAAPVRVQFQLGEDAGAIALASMWMQDLNVLQVVPSDLHSGLVLAADLRIGEEDVWRGDALVPRHLEQIKGAGTDPVSIFEEDLPLQASS